MPRTPGGERPATDGAAVYQADDETGRKYRVEYLCGSSGKLARSRGRVALTPSDLPPELRKLPKVRPDGGYQHVYVRQLNLKELTGDDTQWYQPMFKKRWTRCDEQGNKASGVDWFARLGSYWCEETAAVAAELAMQRYQGGQTREQIETVEADIVEAARQLASRRKK